MEGMGKEIRDRGKWGGSGARKVGGADTTWLMKGGERAAEEGWGGDAPGSEDPWCPAKLLEGRGGSRPKRNMTSLVD